MESILRAIHRQGQNCFSISIELYHSFTDISAFYVLIIAVHLKRTKSLSRGQLSDDPVAVKGIGDDSHLFHEHSVRLHSQKIR